MQRKFLTNLALLLLLNILVKPFYIFGIDMGVQNTVGSDEYGFYFVIFNFSFLFNILLDLGITQFNNRAIARDSNLLNRHFSSILIVKLFLGMIYFLITFTAAFIIGYGTKQFYFLGFLAFNQFLLMFIQYLRSNVSGLLLFKTDSILSVLDRVLMILICGALLWGGIAGEEFRIEWFIYSQTTSYLLTALIAISIVIKKASFKRLNWDWPFILSIIKNTYPFAILVLLMTFTQRVDTVIINKLLPGQLGDTQAGIYAHAYRLLDAFSNYALLFSVLLLPLFSRMIKTKDNVEHLVKLAFTLLFTGSVIISLTSCFYSYEIMDFLYNDHIEESARMFEIIMFAFIPVSSTYVFGTLLTANGSLKQLNLVYSGAVMISLVLNISLVPFLYALGSAYANLTAQMFAAIAQVIIAVHFFRFRINVNFIILLVSFVLLVLMFNFLSGFLSWAWPVKFAVVFLLSLLAALMMKLLNMKEIIRIVQEKQ